MPHRQPLVVGLGGTTREGSSSERILRGVLDKAGAMGARTMLFTGRDLSLPIYAPEFNERSADAVALIRALRQADAVVVATPGYHGALSGLVKNALDYVEDLRGDARPYLDDRPVGCIASAAGWQGAATALASLRAIVHALRGWPTPLGIAYNSAQGQQDAVPVERELEPQMSIMAAQLLRFTRCEKIAA